MTISVTIDSCAWNHLYEKKIDLLAELPPERFALFITNEVSIELQQIPDVGRTDGADKTLLKEYIRDSIISRDIKTTQTFGFAEANEPGKPARYSGFGQGTFESTEERDWRNRQETQRFLSNKSERENTALLKNEADVSVAIASLSSLLITLDKKKGPIKDAAENGGMVVYLHLVEASGLSLSEFIERHFSVRARDTNSTNILNADSLGTGVWY